METAREIRQERVKAIQSAREIVNKAKAEKRDLTPEERKDFDGYMERANALEADAKRLEGLDAVEDELRKIVDPKDDANSSKPESPAIGLTDQEIRKYSITRLIRAMSGLAPQEAAFELECGRAVAQRMGVAPQGTYIPFDILSAPVQGRAMTVGTVTDGGHLVADELRPASFIDVLRNRSVLAQAGVTMMTGLVGDIPIPRQTAAATVAEKAESTAGDETTPTVDQVVLTPKLIKGWVEYSRQLMNQASIDVENFVRNDLARAVTSRIDLQALHGTGVAPFIKGIAAVTGIGSVVGGDNGLAPTWEHIVKLETEVAVDNADMGSLAYITNAKVRGKLKVTPRVTGTNDAMVWDTRSSDTPLNGYRTLVTNNVSSALTKGTSNGVCSAIFYGNWADLLIGLWGALDVLVNPFAKDKEAVIRVSVFQMADAEVRHAESFSAMLDALTA